MIKKIKFAELETAPNFLELRDEYAAECAIAGLPPIAEKFEMYRAIEDAGFFQLFGAYVNDKLVGFVSVVVSVIPHFGVPVAVAESLFVASQFRKFGLGLELIREAQSFAASKGSSGILFSAPTGGKLEQILPRMGFRATNTTFYKEFI
jgi:GNAT superfamily N-acetyltransferase